MRKPASLINTFVFAIQMQFPLYLKPKFQASFLPVSAIVQAGLCQAWSKTPKTSFLTSWLILFISQNSQESLDHLLYLLNDINMKQLKISSRAYSFALMLPLNLVCTRT